MVSSSQIGKVIDNYRIVEVLGEGGMGVVFKAIHTKLEKVVALKMIVSGLSMNIKFKRRFQTEARALAKIQDPNIVTVHDLRSYDNQWFIVMEYVDGIDLFELINKNGAFSWQDSIHITKQILSAIGRAHNAGIIHRDLKPHNIMLTEDNIVKITDFGLAKDEADKRQTMTVASGGSLNYMSPEHVKGFSYIEKRSDLYCVGIILYEMVTGAVPFKNIDSDFDIRESILRKEFDTPTKINKNIPVELDEIIMKSLKKTPGERFQTAGEMLQALVELENGTHFTYKTIGLVERLKTPLRIAVPILLIFVITIFAFYYDIFLPKNNDTTIEANTYSNLTINTIQENVDIFINDDSIAQSPLKNYELASGSYSLKLVKNNYQTLDTSIQVGKKENLPLTFNLKPIVEKRTVEKPKLTAKNLKARKDVETILGSMYINSNPYGALVYVNNTQRGVTPLALSNIKEGNYDIRISRDGYEDYIQNIRIDSGENERIDAQLALYSGQLAINTNPDNVTVDVDGEIFTINDGKLLISKLPLGKKKIIIAKEGYTKYTDELTIERNITKTINATLSQLMGNLIIKIRPWGTITIDNKVHKSSADTKYETELSADKHMIRIDHPTLGYWQKEIQIRNNVLTEVKVNFNKKIPVTISAFGENGEPFAGKIYINGKYTGKSTPEEVEIPVGVHKIDIEKEGYIVAGGAKEVLIDTDNKKPITFEMKQKTILNK